MVGKFSFTSGCTPRSLTCVSDFFIVVPAIFISKPLFSRNGTQLVKHERQNDAVERQYRNLGEKFYVEFVTSGKYTIFVCILLSLQMFEINQV